MILPVVPMFHANAWGLAQAGVLAGSTFVMPGPDLSPKAIADLMESENVTFAAGVPTIWMGVLDELDGRDLSSLTRILCGGSAVPKSLSEAYREKIGLPITARLGHDRDEPARLGVPHQEHAARPLRGGAGRPARAAGDPVAAGRDPHRRPRDRRGAAVGRRGARRGPVRRARGSPPATTAATARSSSPTTAGCARATSAVITPDGYMKLVDRTKDLVKSGGEWISSVELENEIMAHPKVKEAAVIGIRDDKWGERPLACVVPEEGEELDADDIRGFLDGRVAKWWIPESFEFIDEVPKTSVGKFSKKTLREQFAEVAT